MIVRKIKINNFKSIYDELELNFQDIQGFWKISGTVGAGKTTIGEAIIFGLFGSVQGKNNADLIAWGQKSSLIEVWAESKGHNIYIRRKNNLHGQSPVYVEVDDEPMTFTNKRDAQIQLEQEYFDVSRLTLELLCIISFNNFKSLATLNSQDTKKFLDQVFGFYVLTNYSLICKELEVESNNQYATKQNEYFNTESKIGNIQRIINKARIEGDIDELKREIESINKEYNQLILDKKQALTNINKDIIQVNKEISQVLTLGKNKAKEIKLIEKGICPTCGAVIDKSLLEEKNKERDAFLKLYKEYNEKLNSFKEVYETQNRELDNYIQKQKELVKPKENLIIQLQEQKRQNSINTEEIELLEKERQEQFDAMQVLEKEHNEWSQLYDILTGEMRNKILLSFIPALNDSILKYTQQLQLPYIITFDENFKCNIKLFGMNQEVSVSSLSTGQLKTVDISIILGVLNVIMNNINFNICFLDELFSNMDTELRNIMCTVLKNNLKNNQSLFIISHVELDDKYFDGEIQAKLEYINDILKCSKYNIKFNKK